MHRKSGLASAAALTVALGLAAAPATGMTKPDLNGPRGISIAPGGRMVVAQGNGLITRVIRKAPHQGKLIRVGKVPKQYIAPSVAYGKHREVWALTGSQGPAKGTGTLYLFKPGHHRKTVLNIVKWQKKHPDPYDTENKPKESNPFGLAALPNGNVLVADAANNALLNVNPNGKAHVVARVKPRVIPMPAGMGSDGPPAGTPISSEAVVTSVTVGADGAYYIGELRGFPGTPGTSQIWRIRPGARHAVCNPMKPNKGACKRYVDGLTSIVGLASGRGGSIYALELSKMGWMAVEGGAPGSDVGAVIRISHDKRLQRELKPGKFKTPGGIAVGPRGGVFVTTPVFGPGKIKRAN
jgi:hypothetical protein